MEAQSTQYGYLIAVTVGPFDSPIAVGQLLQVLLKEKGYEAEVTIMGLLEDEETQIEG